MVSRPNAALGERQIFGDGRVEVVHTISMSVLVDRVHRVGIVGLVELGRKFDSPTTRGCRVHGRGPRPRCGTRTWLAPLGGRRWCLRRKPLSFSVSCGSTLRVGRFGHRQAAVDRRWRGAPVFVQLQPGSRRRPICCSSAAGLLALPLPRKPRFIAKPSAASNIKSDVFRAPACRWCEGAGGGAVPTPSIVVTPEARPRRSAAGR